MVKRMIDSILMKPRKIFLIDAIGAFVTAVTLGVIFTKIQGYIGMPRAILSILAFIALGFCIYSFSCYYFLKNDLKPFLKAIAIANLLYCLTTAILIFTLFQQLTIFGLFYFIGEIMVIGILVYFEFIIIYRNRKHHL